MNVLLRPAAFSVMLLATLAGSLAAGCDSGTPSTDFTVTYDPPFTPAALGTTITNEFYPLVPGTTYRYVKVAGGETEEVVFEVTGETRVIAGVTTRVVRDRVTVDGELVEDTFDWFAQSIAGDVWYLGEQTCEYENGICVTTAGSFEAGVDGAEAGVVMPATPTVGQAYYQERYAGEAEDRAVVLSTTASVTVPYGSFTGCLQTYDTTPLNSQALEHKFYCRGVGVVLEVDLTTGERLELVEVTRP